MSSIIKYAAYGVWNSTNDATEVIQKAYSTGTRKFLAHNDLVGDPASGERKFLYIVWKQDGVTYSGVIGEDDDRGIHIP
jgi:hypothetical protein